MNCKIPGCEEEIYARGWCEKHYRKWLKYGNPEYTLIEMHGYTDHPLYKSMGRYETQML